MRDAFKWTLFAIKYPSVTNMYMVADEWLHYLDPRKLYTLPAGCVLGFNVDKNGSGMMNEAASILYKLLMSSESNVELGDDPFIYTEYGWMRISEEEHTYLKNLMETFNV